MSGDEASEILRQRIREQPLLHGSVIKEVRNGTRDIDLGRDVFPFLESKNSTTKRKNLFALMIGIYSLS